MMRVVYTKHAEDKLKRADIKGFKINKTLIEDSLAKPKHENKTKYGELAFSCKYFHQA